MKNIESIEIDLLVEGIYRHYGYDFRNYSRASLKRRLTQHMNRSDLSHLSELIPRVLHDPAFFNALFKDMSITVTEMFRDPDFYKMLRKKVIPILKTYPFVKIWHAGCATGEEVYSMAIVLSEEGYYDKCHIYATDFNTHVLDKAKEGIYPLERIRQYMDNYNQSGRKASFSDYFTAAYQSAKMINSLKKQITFTHHNLATDKSFGEMNMIVCRNVLIYFDKKLQNRALSLFHESLCHGGFLCLGKKETINFSSVQDGFQTVSETECIFKKTSASTTDNH